MQGTLETLRSLLRQVKPGASLDRAAPRRLGENWFGTRGVSEGISSTEIAPTTTDSHVRDLQDVATTPRPVFEFV